MVFAAVVLIYYFILDVPLARGAAEHGVDEGRGGAEARCGPTDGSPEGRPVARDRKNVGLSPSIDLSKRVHAGMMRR